MTFTGNYERTTQSYDRLGAMDDILGHKHLKKTNRPSVYLLSSQFTLY